MLSIKSFTFNYLQQNTFVLYNQHHNAIIIDPGCYFPSEKRTLHEFITNNGLTVKKLLNTHCHLDHVFGNKWVHETFGLQPHIHPEEEKILAYATQSGIEFGLPFDNYEGPLHFFDQGDTIALDEDLLKVIHLPGHSPGSVGFYSESPQFIISGDVIFRLSVGRTDLPYSDFNTLVSSIKNKLFQLPDQTLILCGHGGSTTISQEKLDNPYVK